MTGKLYGVGIGPGDPELMTIKAKRVLEEVQVWAAPKAALEKASLALAIAAGAVNTGKETVELLFPMSLDEKILQKSWNQAIGQVRQKLDEGKKVAFLTLGDPTVFSTYMYIHQHIRRAGYAVEIVPGVTSFCASAAKAGVSLGENKETIAIIPSAYECHDLERVFQSFDNIVLMKVSKNLSKLKAILKTHGLVEKCVLVSKCGMEDERVSYDMDSMNDESLSYFSTLIVKKSGVEQL